MLRNTLKTLLMPWGPSGSEHNVAETVKTLLAGHVDSMRTDALGNLIVEKYGTDDNAQRIMVSAHMDHIGLIVTGIEKEGYLRVTNVGGVSLDFSRARHVVFENGVDGVAFVQPVKEGKPTLQDLYVDIGASDKEEAETMVQLGDICVYAPDVFPLGKNKISGPAMDNRVACALLTELLLYTQDQKNTIVGVFSTQEEVGLRGASVAAFGINPDLGLAIDVTGAGDIPEEKFPAVNLGDGPAVKIMDRSMIASPLVRDKLFDAAEAAGVKVQREVLPYGGTDGGAIQHARAGIPTGTLSIACRYVHSACETVDVRDMEGALKVLLEFVDIA
ncbi:MAG: M20/M25/M40 family metallo-hydrolase [Eubacteriales bacterium]|jgi:endoglucanase|nr:M20/M25/M40 family metallo-hydrolase [Eubacteriales bacterium]MDD4105296.1 M20/M25/M40 family metallo-hydrolase [Eubacteriales bacterium]MDD4710823.1 M20/M25/M40 family metallo-hydrolase [Eubacteriales bacterium]NLO14476.1 M42 family metallopeptidase [Clostridiales bacterium]